MVGQQYTPLHGGNTPFDADVSSEPLYTYVETSHQSSLGSLSKSHQDQHDYELNNLKGPQSKSSLIPATDDRTQAFHVRFLRKHGLTGWKVGVLTCAATTILVCLLNIALTIWATTNHNVEDGISYLFTGSCKEVARLSLWVHLGINVMSTLLLSASNYTMQIIGSPTRVDIDAAHKQFKWLDIGVPSLRNLGRLPGRRRVMWGLLFLSSVPLHLLYNTAVFGSLSGNYYNYLIVSEEFLTPTAQFNDTGRSDLSPNGKTGQLPGYGGFRNDVLEIMHKKAMNSSLDKLEPENCMELYSQNFVSKSRNVLLITSDKNEENTMFTYGRWNDDASVSYSWICGDGYPSNPYMGDGGPVCSLAIAKTKAGNWTVLKHPINYCMVETVEENCKLRFSLGIMIVVILSNAAKAGVMIWTFWKLKGPPLVTIGDAAASFLTNPDPTTKGMCITTMDDIRKGKWESADVREVKQWNSKTHYWFAAASQRRWIVCNSLCIITIATAMGLYVEGNRTLGISNIKQLYELGIGAVNPKSFVNINEMSLIVTVLAANLPQAILSFLYLTYNGMYSCVLGGREWSLFAKRRRTLRVTSPVGKQRSTYWLQLPYYYAIPLLLLSGLLHWLVSQSLFLAYVDLYNDVGKRLETETISKIGYSCIAIFYSIIVGTVSILAGIMNGFRRYDSRIPIVGSCSAAISAACHRPADDEDAALEAVKWGVVEREDTGGVGHCCLSSFEVREPVEGARYAGMKPKEQ